MKVLLLEDNEKMAALTTEGLRLSGLVADTTDTLENALYLTEVETYDVIILDRMLPDGDGLEACRQLRARHNNTPILMLTALADLNHRIEGFENGADDYLAKPFELRELVARIKALARRGADTPHVSAIASGDVTIDIARRTVLVKNSPVRLTKRMWNLLEYLALHQGQTVSKETLIDHVWGIESEVLDNTVEAAVSKLRRRLGDTQGLIVQTDHSLGYRLR